MAKERSVDSLRSFYRVGREVCKMGTRGRNKVAGRLARGRLDQICKQLGRNRNEIAKARKFALLYSGSRLKRLLSLGRTQGQPITKTHVCRLVSVRTARNRDRLARECAEQCWTVLQLEDEIRKVQPKRAYGGRTLNRPATLDDALHKTSRMADRWIHLTEMLVAPDEDDGGKQLSSQLPARLRQKQIDITAEMRKLQRQVRRRLKRPPRARVTKLGSRQDTQQ